ncbi:MAG TPA: hypothetical protein VGP19_15320 [Candidatus Acidoferrales bacterium]|jgi:hypothetical protein|nr:hypothetical protein [Candidatus Acidoferrales bacterium]
MKAKTIRHAIEVGLFAAVLLATWAFAAAANAQSFSARFTLPFAVHWGKSVLPAGDYTLKMISIANVALVQSVDGKTAGYTPIPITAASNEGNTALSVMVRGNERMVRSLNLPSRGITLVYAPATSAEREMLAKADELLTVPVVTAGK